MTSTMTRRTFASLAAATAASAIVGGALSGCAPTGAKDASKGTSPKGTADLVVVGAGAAGLAGAAAAAKSGASVIVLEAAASAGGTTAISGGHYKFFDEELTSLLPKRTEESDATLQKYLDMKPADLNDYGDTLETLQDQIKSYLASDSKQEFDSLEYWLVLHYLGTATDTFDELAAKDVVAPPYKLIYPAYEKQAEIKNWLEEGEFDFEAFGSNEEGGGPFSVNPTAPVAQGSAFITILRTFAEEAGAKIVTNAKVTQLVTEDNRVTGAITESGAFYAANKAVLLASGGYAANTELVAKNDVRWKFGNEGLGSCEPESNDGSALMAAQEIGAATANLGYNQYQTFPASGASSIEETIPMCMMASKIAVNKEGKRFLDDSNRFATQSSMISLGQTDSMYYLIGDAGGIEAMGDLRNKYLKTGDLTEGDTIEEAANAQGLDGAAVAAEVALYNSYVDAGADPDFGREKLGSKIEGAPYTIMAMREYVQHTMGGVVIDETGHVVDQDGNAIEGLFAAGEAVGNLDGAQRRHGDNFAQILYYGCLCGKTVTESL